MDSTQKRNLYERAGITDLAEFYRTRYVSGELLDARYFHALNRFDIRFSRTMWVYDNVRSGSSVLDLGCGAGTLALLKRKNVSLAGVDISTDCAASALRNGYDKATAAHLTQLPFNDNSFDYVASLDVMGHVEFEEKDRVLSEIKRVLRADGITLHGIECLDRTKRKDYDEMSAEELSRFVQIDGHVGMEDETETVARFRRYFNHVEAAPRYSICQSAEELLKLAAVYGDAPADADFLEYLSGLSFKERRAFNMAMGYVFEKISEHAIALPASEYLFLKASDGLLADFYGEHRDRSRLFPKPVEADAQSFVCLDRTTRAAFDAGWYDAELFPPVARWMGRRARLNFNAVSLSKLCMDITTHIPDIAARPLALEFFLNGERAAALSLMRHGWLEIEIVNPQSVQSEEAATAESHAFTLEIRADRTWQPRPDDEAQRDDRELSIAVCNIEMFV